MVNEVINNWLTSQLPQIIPRMSEVIVKLSKHLLDRYDCRTDSANIWGLLSYRGNLIIVLALTWRERERERERERDKVIVLWGTHLWGRKKDAFSCLQVSCQALFLYLSLTHISNVQFAWTNIFAQKHFDKFGFWTFWTVLGDFSENGPFQKKFFVHLVVIYGIFPIYVQTQDQH